VVGGDEVLATCHFLGGADEFDFHIAILKFAPKLGKKSEVAMFCHLTLRLFLAVAVNWVIPLQFSY
jgi:hypothetical protein